MGTGDYLGEFEQIVLLAVARLRDDGYGMRIRQEIDERIGRAVSIGAAYATLDRLVGKGCLETRLGKATAVRGGRARRYYRLTAAGDQALNASKKRQQRMWAGVKLESVSRKT